MEWPITTGELRRLLDIPEHKLNNLIRLNKLSVPLVCGRRAWTPENAEQAAKLLGKDTMPLRNLLRNEREAGR